MGALGVGSCSTGTEVGTTGGFQVGVGCGQLGVGEVVGGVVGGVVGEVVGGRTQLVEGGVVVVGSSGTVVEGDVVGLPGTDTTTVVELFLWRVSNVNPMPVGQLTLLR